MSASNPTIAVVVGNPRPRSRTRLAAQATAAALAEALGGDFNDAETIDLAELDPPATGVGGLDDATAQVSRAEVVLFATPVYKTTYTGLLKVFLDQLPIAALEHAVAVPVTVSAAAAHRDLADAALRPVLAELGASLPVPGLRLLESQLADTAELALGWARAHARVLAAAAYSRQKISGAAL